MINFKPVTLHARDLDDCWFMLLDYLSRYGRNYDITAGSYAGQKRSTFDYVAGFINHPHNRPLAPRVPESCTLPPPTTDNEIEQYFANYLMNSELEPNEDYRYATWIVGGRYEIPKARILFTGMEEDYEMAWDSPGVIEVPNQLEWMINHFKEKGLGNAHCYITIGYPESSFAYDIPYENETERRTSPCLRGLDFKVIDGKYLTTHVIYRSWDLVAGWPTNMGGFTLLNEYVANELDIEPGPLSFSCKDLHAYDHTWEYLRARLGK